MKHQTWNFRLLSSFASLMLSPVIAGSQSKVVLHFPVPTRIRGSSVHYLNAYKLKPVSRALSAPERSELRQLFIWAGDHVEKHHDYQKGVNIHCPLYLLAAKEYPQLTISRSEIELPTKEISFIATVLRKNMNYAQACEYLNQRTDAMMAATHPKTILGFRYPKNASEPWFFVERYIDTYPIPNSSAKLDRQQKQVLYAFYKQGMEIKRDHEDKPGLLGTDTKIMALVRSNFPSVRALRPAKGEYWLYLDTVEQAMKHDMKKEETVSRHPAQAH